MTIIFNLLNIRCLADVVMPDAEIAGTESSQFYEIRIESDTKKKRVPPLQNTPFFILNL